MHEQEPAQWNREVFVADTKPLAARDIIHAAHFRGELEPCWRELRVLVESEEKAAELDEPDEAALQSRSEEFRYERDLITTEETEHWLDERGLTLEDFNDYFLRHYWKDALGEEIEPTKIDYFLAPEELRDLLAAELWLSGDLDRMAVQLSRRFAALHVAGGETTRDLVETERANFYKRAGLDDESLPEWLTRMGRDPQWLEEMLKLEAAYRRQRAALLTPEELARALQSLRMPLTRLDVESMELESRDAAREALLCIREDGESMEQVASEGRYPYWRDEVALEDFPADWQRLLLNAVPGQVVEPLEREEGFQLCRLIRKSEPDLMDAKVRGRVERQILERHFSELSARCVRWIIPPSNTQ